MIYAEGTLLAAVLTPHRSLGAGAELQKAAEAWAEQHVTPPPLLVPQPPVTYHLAFTR